MKSLKGRPRGAMVVHLLALCACAGQARTVLADPPCNEDLCDECEPISCSGVDTGTFDAPTSFDVDRRPGVVLQLSNGSANEYQMATWWYDGDYETPCEYTDGNTNCKPDVVEELLERMEDCYQMGFRRIMLRGPAGNEHEGVGHLFDSSQWWNMPAWRRHAFETMVADWIEEKAIEEDPVSVAIYGGYRPADPCSHGMYETSNPDTTDSGDMCVMYRNIKPWIDVGIAEYWMDNSSTDWANMITIQNSADYDGIIKLAGETVPSATTCSSPGNPNSSAIEAGAWICTFAYAMTRFSGPASVNPVDTEVSIMMNSQRPGCMQDGDVWFFDDAVAFHDAGWVLWPEYLSSVEVDHGDGSPYNDLVTFDYSFRYGIETVMRIYDFGTLTAMIDFNGDGLIEVDSSEADIEAFVDAYTLNSDTYGTYLEGDANGSGYIDIFDFLDFIDAIAAYDFDGTKTPAVLGDPWWVP